MRVLLLVPTHKYTTSYPALLSVSDFPSGLAYIAASLKKAGYEVTGLNLNNILTYKNAHDMVTNEISKALETKYDLIGIGGICIDYPFIRDAMEVIRLFTRTPVVLGGGIINNDHEFVFNLLKPDYCIIGEAEDTIVSLCNALESGSSLESIDNLGYWDDGAKFTKLNYTYGNINERPFPDYEVFNIKEMVDKYSIATRVTYRYPREYPRPFIITTARSCPFKCTFCTAHPSKYRVRSIENIMDEIKELYETYEFNILIIQDELFAVNKKRMYEFCIELLKKKQEYGWDFNWMFQTHASSNLDDALLSLAKKTGCFFFSYGLESGSPKVLESMNKKTDIEQVIQAINLANEVHIGFGGNLIFGDTAETKDTILETLDFYQQYCYSSMVFMSDVRPYPGSSLFEYCLEKGIITDKVDFYEHIDKNIYNMTSMPDNEYYSWLNFISMLEQMWLMVKTVDAYKWEQCELIESLKAHVYKVHTVCPYCGSSITYRQIFGGDVKGTRTHLGTGCTKCNKRIRVNLKEKYYVG